MFRLFASRRRCVRVHHAEPHQVRAAQRRQRHHPHTRHARVHNQGAHTMLTRTPPLCLSLSCLFMCARGCVCCDCVCARVRERYGACCVRCRGLPRLATHCPLPPLRPDRPCRAPAVHCVPFFQVFGATVYCLDRDGRNRTISIDCTEYLFKLALTQRKYDQARAPPPPRPPPRSAASTPQRALPPLCRLP